MHPKVQQRQMMMHTCMHQKFIMDGTLLAGKNQMNNSPSPKQDQFSIDL